MLVEHLVGRREHDTGVPIDAHEILIAFIPKKRMPRPLDHQDVEIGPMPVAFFIGPHGHFRRMTMHHPVAEAEADIARPTAAVFPPLELETGDIGDQVRHPHETVGLGLDHFAVTVEPAGLTKSARESGRVVENEIGVMEQVDHDAEIIPRHQTRCLTARAVEMPVTGIKRDCENTVRAPFEGMGGAVQKLDTGGPMSVENIDHLFIKMALRRGRGPRRDIDHEHRHEVAPALEMDDGTACLYPGPRRGFHLAQIDPEILHHRQPLFIDPQKIGIDQDFLVPHHFQGRLG